MAVREGEEGRPRAPTPMTTKAASLDGIELLRPLSSEARAALARRCSWRSFRQGEEILARDSDSTDVLFICEGRVRVVNYSASGREVAYAVIPAGGHVGELSAIDGKPRSASVVALEDCRIAFLPASALMELVETNPPVATELLRGLARVIRDNDERITELATVGAMQRVYRELLRLAEPDPANPGGLVILKLPTQENLAAQIGTTRETVARVLAQLARAKITQRRSRTLIIHDQEQLEALADPTAQE